MPLVTGEPLITVPELAAEALGTFLATDMHRRFGSSHARLTELVPSLARLALECIGNSDALYHNVEHTMLVTLAGHDIMKGRALLAPVQPVDYAHFIAACLMHDIGYVRGVLKGDDEKGIVIDAKGQKTTLPRGSSDAALLPYHVDRSKLFVMDRLGTSEIFDAARIANAIEFTRFPSTSNSDDPLARRRLAAASRRPDRPAGRSPLPEKGRRAVLRVRGSRHEQAARIQFTRRPCRALSAILLEDGFDADPGGNSLSQRHVKRAAVDRKSL